MHSSRSGFTIVEVLIAIIVLAVALLGLVATTAATIRVLGEGDRAANAAFHATRQLERLEALACDAASSGSETRQGVDLSWTVGGTPTDNTRSITLTASYSVSRGRVRVDTFSKALQCVR